ncbi:NADH dehydrogenase subunit G [Jatrophihabitans endophyticus]|uniref:NADH-quinone oxidoreductase n=1 Tax=Jatrophihabitans endophyticus TaxID=1206085 RepID=A0A1M5GVX3_9ACTN|nr:NADH-quinone oxidoreductase subunit G [Jatrophihabitans endophyticus]SHG07860.1 NADH dehydrogenase subunit G [Jatrophihabitans endophyticus]
MTEAPAKEDLISVTIDGLEISVPKGTLLIRAAEQLGISIPRFCDHPLLDPAGACRQCLVEVTDMGNGRGMPKPAASCTTTVMPGMVIKTQLTSAVADKAQQGVMELLLINHPLDCPICDKGGECPLQNQAMSNGRADSRFHETKRTFPKPVAISSNVLLDRERCVLCQRCTRFSLQIAGDPFIDLLERGAQQQIGTSEEVPFQSYFSGNTVQICPVGALTSASYRFRARPFDLQSTDSICEHCSSGCAQRTDWRRGKVTRRLAGNDPEVNEEWNCDKGRWAFQYLQQADRVLNPLVRNADGELVETSWPDALERAAQGLAEAVDRGGVGVLPGGRLTEEDAYAYAKFARVALGTNDVDARTRPVSDEELAFLGSHVAGLGPEHVSFTDLEHAPAVLLVGLEPEEEAASVFLRLRKGSRNHGARVFSLAAYASRGLTKLAGTLLPTVPGAEGEALDSLPGDVVGALGGPGALILLGERLATSPGALSAAVRLATETGARLAWIPRRAGERAAIDTGALPTLLPGGRDLTDAVVRAEVEGVWGAAIPTRPGRDIDGILRATAEGALAALVVGGVEPTDTADPALAEQALANAGFVVSLEIRHSAVTAHADVVLPVAPVTEKAGRFVNWEGRRRPFELTIAGTGAMSDARVLDALAEELDVRLDLASVEAARAELLRLGPAVSRVAAPAVAPSPAPVAAAGEAVLATWSELIDAGRMQDGDEHLAGTAKPVFARVSAATAAEVGIVDGDLLSVSTERGALVLPSKVELMPDRVVWLPTNARECSVRTGLGAVAGATVTLVRTDAPPVVGEAQ